MITRRTFFNCLAGSAIAHAIGVSGQQSSTEPRKPVDTLPGAEKNRKLKVVFVGAHVDDWVFCVGTLARYAREGHDVLCFSFTPGDSQAIANAYHMPLDKLAALRSEDAMRGTKLFGARFKILDQHNQKMQEIAHGRTERTTDEVHPWPHRVDQQCNGPHCSRRLSLAHLLSPSHYRGRGPAIHAPAMWWGIVCSALCLATAVAYAEISKLYPGTGSSYYYAEQALLSKDKAFKYARVAKFIVGWGSHLYYWVYPGVMVATTGVFVGYVVGFLYPKLHEWVQPRTSLHGSGRRVFSFFVAWIAEGRRRFHRRQPGHQRGADLRALVFSFLASAIASATLPVPPAPPPSNTTGNAGHYNYQFKTDPKDGSTVRDAGGTPLPLARLSRQEGSIRHYYPDKDSSGNILSPTSAASVVAPHNFSFVFIQATVAILILVGFESVTSMGGEAKNPTKHIPIAVIASLLIQGLLCYLIEYFAANYFLNSGYTMQSAANSAAPIGDMMIIVGDALLGHGNGRYFMLGEAIHRLPGPHRHHAGLHEHRRPRHLRHGQRRRGPRALRHSSRQVAVAAQALSGPWPSSPQSSAFRRLAGLRRCRRAH
jgi:hypothetical protein